MGTITVRITNSYGRQLVYPVCKSATEFAGIAGTKTLGNETIAAIKALGFEIQIQAQTI